jgi:cytochrome c553
MKGISVAGVSALLLAAFTQAFGAVSPAMCENCHGPNGNSVTDEWPNLAGQKEVYLINQLTMFRGGIRRNRVMSPLAQQLSDDDIKALASYFAKQRPAICPNPARN